MTTPNWIESIITAERFAANVLAFWKFNASFDWFDVAQTEGKA